MMEAAEKIINMTLHDGLRKYRAKHSKASLSELCIQKDNEPQMINGKKNKKGAVFITRSKAHLSLAGAKGTVLTSEEAALDYINQATHWTPNVYNYGTYADDKRTILKGHEERNLQQINAFVVDVDSKEAMPGQIALAAMDQNIGMPTFILETDKGYQVYFVLDKPMFVSNKNNYRCIAVAKRISDNLRKALAEEVSGVDFSCNHFSFFRMPNRDNIVWFQAENTFSFAELIDWSRDQDVAHRRKLFTVLENPIFSNSMNQLGEEWVKDIIKLINIKGGKGVIGRDNTLFTLALACFSSGKTEEAAFDLLDEYNSSLAFPVKNQQIRKVIKSAFKGKWKGASREYVENILTTWGEGLDTPFSSEAKCGWYKFKKNRTDRVRSHLSEWEEDMMKYLHAQKESKKGFVYFSQAEWCSELGIPRSTLNKLLSTSTKIYRHVIGKGNQQRTGLATLAMLFNYVMSKKSEQREAFISLFKGVVPKAAMQVVALLKGGEIKQKQGFEGGLIRDGTG